MPRHPNRFPLLIIGFHAGILQFQVFSAFLISISLHLPRFAGIQAAEIIVEHRIFVVTLFMVS